MSTEASLGPLTPLETVTLNDGAARVTIAPARGGMVTTVLRGRSGPCSFSTPHRSPTRARTSAVATPCSSRHRAARGRAVRPRRRRPARMKQHGFARQECWTVIARTHGAYVTLRLVSTDETRPSLRGTLWSDFATRSERNGAHGRDAAREPERDAAGPPSPSAFTRTFHVADADKARARSRPADAGLRQRHEDEVATPPDRSHRARGRPPPPRSHGPVGVARSRDVDRVSISAELDLRAG